MNTVMQKIRTKLVKSIQATLGINQKIQSLKWAEGSQPEVQRLRSIKDDEGRRVNGKRSLKPYHRPETGPERHNLWVQKRDLRRVTRKYLLLLAMLRGKEYKTVEAKCRGDNYPPIYRMTQILEWYFEKGKCPIGMGDINNWVQGSPAPKLVEEDA